MAISSKTAQQLLEALERGHVSFPMLFFMRYRDLGLTDQEAMLLLQILTYQQTDGKFPEVDVLASRMSLSKDEIAASLQRFTLSGVVLHEGLFLSIRPLIERMVGMGTKKPDALSVFHQFESEFGRLLSPLEQEQIARWLEEDEYPEWMIVEALRESVLSGVYKFRYVDTVLREWSRSHIKSEQELSAHREQHRTRPNASQGRSRGAGVARASDAKQGSTRGETARVVPAAQPGKYERFYQLYKNRDEAAATSEK
ncbi:MAG: DnaD domain protein [Firmicutes bacterium]|nr:DnaD domain protein [Bacillota bacterium]